MNTLRNMRIASKIISILVLASIALGAVGFVGYYFMKQMDQMAIEMYEVRMAKVNLLNDMRRLSRLGEGATYEIFLATNPAQQRAAIERGRKSAEDLDKAWDSYKKMTRDPFERERESRYEQLLVQYRGIRQQALDLAQAGQGAAAYALFKQQGERPLEEVNTVRRDLANYNTDQSKKLAMAIADYLSKATLYMAGIAILAIILCFAFGLLVSRMVSNALQRLTEVANRMAIGDVNVTIQKDSKDETGVLAEAFDVMANNIRNAANAAEKISAGDLSVNIKIQSDKDVLGKSLEQCITNVKLLVADAGMLSVAAVEGKLDTRADASKHGGDFRKIVEGVNKTLDAVIGPLNVAAEYVDRISKGDIPPKITDNYNGDFNEIKNNLNQAIDAVNALVADAGMLSVAAVEGKLDTRADATKHGGDFRKIVEGVNKTLDAVIGPLNVAAEYVDRISKGDIPPKITDSYNGDFNEIKNNLNQAIDAVNALVADAGMLSVAAVEGKLDTRADATKHGGDFRKIVEGVNKTLDAVIGPLNVAAEYVDRISKGDIPPKITDNYNGDFNEIKNNLNNCIDNLNGLISEMKHMSDEHDRGDIDVVIDAAKFQGAYKVMGEGVNTMVNGHIAVKKKAMACIGEFGRGNFEASLEQFPGKKAFINQTIEQVRENLKALIADANMLSVAAVEGKLDTRADATKHQGDFRKIVEGVNKTLDAVIGPLNVAAEYVDRISKGDIPPKITDNYNGDFNEIKNNLNNAIDNINALVFDANMLVEAAVAGKLATRADASKHGGDFRKIVEGVNKTLDAVIGPLNVAADYVDKISKGDIPAKITDSYNGDFNTIKNNLNQAIDAVNALVSDAGMLVTAAVEGKLATRADATKHQGDYRKIVEGVNKTLDAVIGPLNVAADYVDKISKGDIPPKITDSYNGDFNTIKNNLNNAIDNINALVADAGMLSVAAVEGKLATRADATKHGGDYRKIVEGVNKTLDAVIGPLNVAADYVDKISKGDIPAKITDSYNGDFNTIKNNLNQAIDAVNSLVSDAGMLSVAAVEGKLATRADATKHQGDYRKIVEGVNKTLDAVIGPLNVAADYVDKISKGDIPAKITDNYNGDFNTIKNNLNQAIDAVNALVSDAGMLVTAAVEGKLATRADATKHQGDYRKIVEGVNKTLDAVIGPLNVAADYVDKISRGNMPPVITDSYNGDFNTIKNNLNRCIEAVNGLIAESVMLSKAAVEGRLQTRGKADKFEGGYREIVQGVNDTLDAVLKPIEEAAECLKEMSNGNLNVEVKGNYQGDHAIIKDALNGTIDAMNDILGQVSVAVEQVSAGSREIATSSQALSQGATESASAVEEISASMQEMGSQTNQNAENATQANQLAVLARDNAEKGNGQMTQMVKAMGDINQSANNISKIIKVIDEIAFQTNLLALNAAVEAARAGKHGKGFTVVAEEVRNLAQRSAKAAKETTEMIEDSIKRTEIGTTIAENTSKALEEIVVGATKVTDLISEIAAASKEQAQGIGQINNGLGQVDQVTQQNTASAEEMASAGEELSSQSLQLKQMLAKFQLKKAVGSPMGGYGGYGGESFNMGPSTRQSASRQKVDVPWGGTPAKSGRKNARGGEVKAEEIISLDDQHFGKF